MTRLCINPALGESLISVARPLIVRQESSVSPLPTTRPHCHCIDFAEHFVLSAEYTLVK